MSSSDQPNKTPTGFIQTSNQFLNPLQQQILTNQTQVSGYQPYQWQPNNSMMPPQFRADKADSVKQMTIGSPTQFTGGNISPTVATLFVNELFGKDPAEWNKFQAERLNFPNANSQSFLSGKRRKIDGVQIDIGTQQVLGSLGSSQHAPTITVRPHETGDHTIGKLAAGYSKIQELGQHNRTVPEHTIFGTQFLQDMVDKAADEAEEDFLRNNGPVKNINEVVDKFQVRLNAKKRVAAEIKGKNADDIEQLMKVKTAVDFPQLHVGGDVHQPTPLCVWPLIQAFRTELLADPPTKENLAVVDATRNFLNEAQLLFTVQCRVCQGYGHSSTYCSTATRFNITNPGVKKLYNNAVMRAQTNLQGNEKADSRLRGMIYKIPKGFLDKDDKVKKSHKRDRRDDYF